MDLEARGRIHFIGIGGAGMSAIAKVLVERGVQVSGSDLKRSSAATLLEAIGASVSVGHDAALVRGAGAVVVSSAIPETNPELAAARAAGVPVITRGEALAAVLRNTRAIVVAGTHGKTTTTSMVVSILRAAGISPTYLVGAGLNESGTNASAGSDDVAVAESDESDGSFLLLEPTVSVVTNIELDHVDHWGSLEELRAAFERFVAQTDPRGAAVLPAGEGDLAAGFPGPVTTFGGDGDVTAADVETGPRGARFTLLARGDRRAVEMRVPGVHNVANALAATAACLAVGAGLDAAERGLAGFMGVERRFQTKGSAGGVVVVDDYAHHPTEIRATLEAARATRPRRLVAVFQPHRYSRTAALARAFGDSFSSADRVVVTDVYGAGEEPVPGVSGKLISDEVCRAAPGKPVAYLPHRQELVGYLETLVRAGDLVLTLGAGDVTSLGDELIARMQGRA